MSDRKLEKAHRRELLWITDSLSKGWSLLWISSAIVVCLNLKRSSEIDYTKKWSYATTLRLGLFQRRVNVTTCHRSQAPQAVLELDTLWWSLPRWEVWFLDRSFKVEMRINASIVAQNEKTGGNHQPTETKTSQTEPQLTWYSLEAFEETRSCDSLNSPWHFMDCLRIIQDDVDNLTRSEPWLTKILY